MKCLQCPTHDQIFQALSLCCFFHAQILYSARSGRTWFEDMVLPLSFETMLTSSFAFPMLQIHFRPHLVTRKINGLVTIEHFLGCDRLHLDTHRCMVHVSMIRPQITQTCNQTRLLTQCNQKQLSDPFLVRVFLSLH